MLWLQSCSARRRRRERDRNFEIPSKTPMVMDGGLHNSFERCSKHKVDSKLNSYAHTHSSTMSTIETETSAPSGGGMILESKGKKHPTALLPILFLVDLYRQVLDALWVPLVWILTQTSLLSKSLTFPSKRTKSKDIEATLVSTRMICSLLYRTHTIISSPRRSAKQTKE